jgi:predicted branched-subunit amino acid permease
MVPILPGIVPAGIAVGTTLAASSVPLAAGLVSSATVYGASAQLVVLDMTRRGAPPMLVVATVTLVCCRLAMYSAGLARHFCGAGRIFRVLGPLMLVDPTYMVVEDRLAMFSAVNERRDFYLGAGLTLWLSWQGAHAVGVIFGTLIPAAFALDFALPLCLLALLAGRLGDLRARAAAVVAATCAVVTAGFPVGTGLLIAAALGVLAGTGHRAPRGPRVPAAARVAGMVDR